MRDMPRPRRIDGELTSIKFFMLIAPSEYLELRDAAADEGESMAEYVRRSIAIRYEQEHPNRLPFGARYR